MGDPFEGSGIGVQEKSTGHYVFDWQPTSTEPLPLKVVQNLRKLLEEIIRRRKMQKGGRLRVVSLLDEDRVLLSASTSYFEDVLTNGDPVIAACIIQVREIGKWLHHRGGRQLMSDVLDEAAGNNLRMIDIVDKKWHRRQTWAA